MQFYNLHTHKFTNNPVIFELVNQYPWEFDATIPQYSIGIHPWYINENRLETDLQIIEEKLKLPECFALGECGLDKRIEVSMSLQMEVSMIIHGFSKSEQLAKQLIDNGFYLSFGKYLLRNPELEAVFKSIPNDRFFLETDTIDETLEEVYKIAASYKNVTVEALQKQVEVNWKRVIG